MNKDKNDTELNDTELNVDIGDGITELKYIKKLELVGVKTSNVKCQIEFIEKMIRGLLDKVTCDAIKIIDWNLDEDYVYPLNLKLNGYTVLVDTNGGKNMKKLFKKKDIIDMKRFKEGKPWIRKMEVMKWAKQIDGMKKMGGFNSNGWCKTELNKKIYKDVQKDKMMLLFVKNRIFR